MHYFCLIVSLFSLVFELSGFAGPLHDAAKAGDLVKVKQLLSEGAIYNELDSEGHTPLEVATSSDVIEFLTDYGSKSASASTGGLQFEFAKINLELKPGAFDFSSFFLPKVSLIDNHAIDRDSYSSIRITQGRQTYGPWIVLQGEVGFSSDIRLHTSTPDTCTVVAVYNHEKSIGALAHIDNYVSIPHFKNFLNQKLESNFGLNLNKNSFTITIVGGTSDQQSVRQKKTVIAALRSFGEHISVQELDLRKGGSNPQIILDPKDGSLQFLYGKEANPAIEFLQRREYGDFNSMLDQGYGDLSGDEIPYFEIKEATRRASDLPDYVEGETLEDLLKKEVRVRTNFKREVVRLSSFFPR